MNKVYEFVDETEETVLKFGSYSEKVYNKHCNSYGEKGARNTRETVNSVLNSALKQEADTSATNNVLLVGKVQSGKTSNLEALVALACDNGFELVVMYGGYDNTLLGQTVKRFRKTFDAPRDEDDLGDPNELSTPVIFTTDDKDDLNMAGIDAEVLRDYFEADVPVFIITIKGAPRLNLINDVLEELSDLNLRTLIIDDEGDQASLNNAKDKKSEASATYAAICRMKKVLHNPLYFSVTATPHANIFLSELSELRPSSIRLLHPAEGYCGAEVYHKNDNDIIFCVADEMDDALNMNCSPDSLRLAVRHFILSSALFRRRQQGKTQMVVHTYKEIAYHKKIYSWIDQYIKELKDCLEDALIGDDEVARIHFLKVYEKCFSEEIRKNNPFSKELIKDMYVVLRRCGVAMQNGRDLGTRDAIKHKLHQIYVGAQLLERGITFDHLLTTYFTRWARTGGNMDTNLQRARWFGYRSSYIELCILFTTETIASEFSFLAEMEDDLWQQFAEVEEGEKPISEIIVLAEKTRQKPTRRTVSDYFVISTSNWLKQSSGSFDTTQVRENNKKIDSFFAEFDFSEESYGRTDGKITCTETVVPGKELVTLFEKLGGIYDQKSFPYTEVKSVLEKYEKIAVVKIAPCEIRDRTFYSGELSGTIKVLQQGRDPNSNTYEGDKGVVDKAFPATLQVYKIRPTVGKTKREDCIQYMFAIYQSDKPKKGYSGR